MTGISTNTNSTNPTYAPSEATRPEHHIHNTDEPLPGAKGAAPTTDYSARTVERTPSSAFQEQPSHISHAAPPEKQGKNAHNTERPRDVKPTSTGGVAVGGHDNLPEGHAGFGDKMIGKTQKVSGKATHNSEMHEKGELRETGGKAAVLGEAQAAHD
ncbi:hypothetical protein FPV67DRAFT_1504019 [Lyophyllum atratum]|nr:hypothetical protein FPV67DRAFT_1504019 [Lyophyllum atratum]